MTSRAQTIPAPIFCIALLVCFLLAGCGDTCVVVTGIFLNTTSNTNPPTCQLGNGNGNVNIGINSVPASPVAPMAPNLRHIFVSIRGIEANPNALATEDSPDWQELAPELATEPVQIDLMPSSVSGGSCQPRLTRKTNVRADLYRQLRLRLVSDQPAPGAELAQHNQCNGLGFNCVVDINGHKHGLALKDGVPILVIASDRIANGFFDVLPDAETHLAIVFDPYSSVATAAGDSVQIVPVFSAETAAECDSPPAPP